MKQSTLLSQKLAGYSAFAAALTGFASSAEAQFVHIDNPEVILGLNQQQNFDLDADGNNDISFKQFHSTYSSSSRLYYKNEVYAYALGTNTKIVSNFGWINPFNINGTIQADYINFNIPSNLGLFENQGEKFIGIKFSENIPGGGTVNNIGWIRITVANGKTSITVLDWAYTPYTDPSTSIYAGQTTVQTSIKPEVVASLLNVSVFPTKVTDNVSINTQDAASYIITNMAGAVVDQGELLAGENPVNTTQLAKGIYLIKINNTNGSVVKRIVKE